MNNEAFGLAVAVGLFRSDQRASLPPHFDLDHVRVADKASLSFQLADGQELPYSEFARRAHAEGVLGVGLAAVTVEPPQELPEHVAAGFMNGTPTALHLTTKQATRLFGMRQEHAPTSTVTGEHLFALVEAQPGKEGLWDYIVSRLNRNLAMNAAPLVPRDGIRQYLSGVSMDFVASWGTTVLETAQEQAFAQGTAFTIPTALAQHFKMGEPIDHLFRERESTFYAHCYVTDRTPTAADFVTLIRAQNDGETLLANLGGTAAFGTGTLTEETADEYAQNVSDALTARRTPVFVPEDLRDCFGPDPEEMKRIEFRSSQSQRSTVGFRPNETRWMNFCFVEIPGAAAAPLARMAPATFAKLAIEAARFASQLSSGFEHAFAAGHWILTTRDVQASTLDQRGCEALAENYENTGLDPRFLEHVLGALSCISIFQPMGYSEQALRALVAFDLCSVLGGMGSWNDMSFDTELEEEQHRALSSKLRQGLQALFAFAINTAT